GNDKKGIRVVSIKPKLVGNINEDTIQSYLLNGVVFILYPFKFEAIIRGILYDNKYYYLDKNNKVATDTRYKPSIEAKEFIKKDMAKKSIIINNFDFLVD